MSEYSPELQAIIDRHEEGTRIIKEALARMADLSDGIEPLEILLGGSEEVFCGIDAGHLNKSAIFALRDTLNKHFPLIKGRKG